jgi:hypothetical protein
VPPRLSVMEGTTPVPFHGPPLRYAHAAHYAPKDARRTARADPYSAECAEGVFSEVAFDISHIAVVVREKRCL